MEKLWPNAPQNYSASFWANNFVISVWENLRTPHFHDLGTFGRVHDSKNQSYVSFGTARHSKEFKKKPNSFPKSGNLDNLGVEHFDLLDQTGAEQI